MPNEKWRGPRFLAQGFRPFFLAAGASAVVGVALWVLSLTGFFNLGSFLGDLAWHAHEMIFGMAAAAVAGFLLTAVPNWTGRLPVRGWPLAGLVGLWLAGRVAMAMDAATLNPLLAVIDLSFLCALLGVMVREIAAGRNWRNLPVMAGLVVLLLANGVTHAEALGYMDDRGIGPRLGISALVALIALVGGRIIPSFTGNWLAKRTGENRPRPFDGFDRLALAVTAVALVSWSFAPGTLYSGLGLIAAGLLNTRRLLTWKGHRTLEEPLVWSLHVAFLWLPVGLLLLGTAAILPGISAHAGIHALTVGAIGGMIAAVMTRATLGHTGRNLSADGVTSAIYVLIFAAAAFRVAASFTPDRYIELLALSATAWCVAFLIFCIRFGRYLVGR